MVPIKNTSKLLATGDIPVRDVLLQLSNTILHELNAEKLIPTLMSYTGTKLVIGEQCWDLSNYSKVVVIGAGKAANHMARAVERCLGDRIDIGLVIVKQVESDDAQLQHIELCVGGHPYPDEHGWKATQRILQIVDSCTQQDIIISVFSGGSSALMNCPVEGISIADERQLTEQLLTAGAGILEVNTVRRHISAVNGGRLAQRVSARGATLINLVISDRVDDAAVGTPKVPVAYTGTQIGIDPTTYADACTVLERYGLVKTAPASVKQHLANGHNLQETPKYPLPGVTTFVIQGIEDACTTASNIAHKANIPAYILTSCLEGDSRQAGCLLAAIAKEIRLNHRPFTPPCVLIAAGETTVRIDGLAGKGGPSQELATAFAHQIAGVSGVGLAAIETEGTDGPTELAGALVDSTTLFRMQKCGLVAQNALRDHDVYPCLTAVGDHLITGNTGTNLCDLNLIYIADNTD